MNIVQWSTGNYGYPRGTHGRKGQVIVAIVDHIMQGTMAGEHAYLADPTKNSYTFGIAKTGRIEQYVALSDAAWGNGVVNRPNLKVPWIKRCVDQSINPNLVTVSIGHEGLTGAPMPEVQVLASIEVHKYILGQVASIVPDVNGITGHFNIDSVNRYYCPGTVFPWTRIRAAVAPATGIGHVLGSPDPWAISGAGSGLVAYGKKYPEFGLPFLRAAAVDHFDADHNEYLKTEKDGHLFLHVYRAATGEIETIAWKV